jgi:hypothetical protein
VRTCRWSIEELKRTAALNAVKQGGDEENAFQTAWKYLPTRPLVQMFLLIKDFSSSEIIEDTTKTNWISDLLRPLAIERPEGMGLGRYLESKILKLKEIFGEGKDKLASDGGVVAFVISLIKNLPTSLQNKDVNLFEEFLKSFADFFKGSLHSLSHPYFEEEEDGVAQTNHIQKNRGAFGVVRFYLKPSPWAFKGFSY